MSWEDFEKKKDSPKPDPIDDILASMFSTPEGEKALIWLRMKTKERVLGPEFSESALRHFEGMRHLVHEIEARIARGKKDNDRSYREYLAKLTSPAGRRKIGYAGRLAGKLLGRRQERSQA